MLQKISGWSTCVCVSRDRQVELNDLALYPEESTAKIQTFKKYWKKSSINYDISVLNKYIGKNIYYSIPRLIKFLFVKILNSILSNLIFINSFYYATCQNVHINIFKRRKADKNHFSKMFSTFFEPKEYIWQYIWQYIITAPSCLDALYIYIQLSIFFKDTSICIQPSSLALFRYLCYRPSYLEKLFVKNLILVIWHTFLNRHQSLAFLQIKILTRELKITCFGLNLNM